jgi:hypothetical protein
MRTTKARAFWAVYAFLSGSLGVVAWRSPDHLVDALGAILAALVAAAATYQGTNVVDNYTKSKHYRAELDPNQPPK